MVSVADCGIIFGLLVCSLAVDESRSADSILSLTSTGCCVPSSVDLRDSDARGPDGNCTESVQLAVWLVVWFTGGGCFARRGAETTEGLGEVTREALGEDGRGWGSEGVG